MTYSENNHYLPSYDQLKPHYMHNKNYGFFKRRGVSSYIKKRNRSSILSDRMGKSTRYDTRISLRRINGGWNMNGQGSPRLASIGAYYCIPNDLLGGNFIPGCPHCFYYLRISARRKCGWTRLHGYSSPAYISHRGESIPPYMRTNSEWW